MVGGRVVCEEAVPGEGGEAVQRYAEGEEEEEEGDEGEEECGVVGYVWACRED